MKKSCVFSLFLMLLITFSAMGQSKAEIKKLSNKLDSLVLTMQFFGPDQEKIDFTKVEDFLYKDMEEDGSLILMSIHEELLNEYLFSIADPADVTLVWVADLLLQGANGEVVGLPVYKVKITRGSRI